MTARAEGSDVRQLREEVKCAQSFPAAYNVGRNEDGANLPVKEGLE